MAGIMDFFKGPTNTDGGAAAPKADTTPPPKDNPAVGPDGKMPGSDQLPVNPLDAYAKMFDNAAKGGDDAPPAFSLDPKTLSEVSSSLDFTRDLPPELLSAAQSGDSKALIDIIRLTSQQAYKAALHHGTTLTDKYIGLRQSHDSKNVGSKIRQELTNSALAEIPNANHPVVKAQLKMVADQMAASNPDARPEEIAKAAQKYILDLANAMNPTPDDKQSSEDQGVDWTKYLS